MSQKSPARQEAEAVLGILLFAIGIALFTLIFSSTYASDLSRLFIGFFAGLFLGGGLDLIIHGARR